MSNKFQILIEQDGECLAIQHYCPSDFTKVEERAKVLLRAWTQNYPCAEACIYDVSNMSGIGYICKLFFVDCFNDISSKATWEYEGTTELSEREEDRYNDIWWCMRDDRNLYQVEPNENDFDWLKP